MERYPVQIAVRVSRSTRELVKKAARRNGLRESEFIRSAVEKAAKRATK